MGIAVGGGTRQGKFLKKSFYLQFSNLRNEQYSVQSSRASPQDLHLFCVTTLPKALNSEGPVLIQHDLTHMYMLLITSGYILFLVLD